MLLFKNIIVLCLFLFGGKPHPFYLSVTDIKYNEKNKSLEISCKMFTGDLEDALKKIGNNTIDLIHPKDKKEIDKILYEYINKRLIININGKLKILKYIGYEKEDDVIWAYMEIEKCEKPKQLNINNSLLYDFLKEQINIVQTDVNADRQSSRVSNPDKEIKFTVK